MHPRYHRIFLGLLLNPAPAWPSHCGVGNHRSPYSCSRLRAVLAADRLSAANLLPLVDVITDLTPTGKTGDIVRLEAKVTINNRGSVPVYVGATVMRITAYPTG